MLGLDLSLDSLPTSVAHSALAKGSQAKCCLLAFSRGVFLIEQWGFPAGVIESWIGPVGMFLSDGYSITFPGYWMCTYVSG